MKAKLSGLLVAVFILASSLLPLAYAAPASTVNPSVDYSNTGFRPFHTSFYSETANRLFVLYYKYMTGTYKLYYNSSANNGTSWSTSAMWYDTQQGSNKPYFTLYFDGTYVHVAIMRRVQTTNNALYYYRGTPNANGTITFSPQQIVALASTSYYFLSSLSITQDTTSHIYIGYVIYNFTSGTYATKVTK